MHPDVARDAPGACPKCGMAIEPAVGTEGDGELAAMTRRFWISLPLSAATVALGMMHRLPWLQAVLAAPVVLWAAAPFFRRGWTLRPNMFTLISIGVAAAYGYSFFAHDSYFESAAAIVTLVLLGQVLELRARRATRGAIRALLELAPKVELRVGDRVRVKPGERVPADGRIVEGSSS